MPLNLDDPRLTAYALGELEDTERLAVEADLAENSDAQRFVEDVRATARLLTEELHHEPAPALHPEQRYAILDGQPRFSRFRFVGLGIAASLLAMMGALAVWATSGRESDTMSIAMVTSEPDSDSGVADEVSAPSQEEALGLYAAPKEGWKDTPRNAGQAASVARVGRETSPELREKLAEPQVRDNLGRSLSFSPDGRQRTTSFNGAEIANGIWWCAQYYARSGGRARHIRSGPTAPRATFSASVYQPSCRAAGQVLR